jgi:hypothetical protein
MKFKRPGIVLWDEFPKLRPSPRKGKKVNSPETSGKNKLRKIGFPQPVAEFSLVRLSLTPSACPLPLPPTDVQASRPKEDLREKPFPKRSKVDSRLNPPSVQPIDKK